MVPRSEIDGVNTYFIVLFIVNNNSPFLFSRGLDILRYYQNGNDHGELKGRIMPCSSILDTWFLNFFFMMDIDKILCTGFVLFVSMACLISLVNDKFKVEYVAKIKRIQKLLYKEIHLY